ncbi:hypothetical protein ACF0H5_002779 [Mactra antiquata]
MHLVRRSATSMEDSSNDYHVNEYNYGVTRISLDLANMTFEEIQKQFELLENFTAMQRPEDLDILKETNWRIAIIIIYCIVILIGFLENVIIVCVLIKNRHLHVPTNIFILGLATSDILLCSFNLPFQLHYQLTDQWAFGDTLCRVIMPTYGVPVFVSSMSILMIAIDRYMLIVHPFRSRMTPTTAVCLVVSITLFTTILAIPIIMQMEYKVVDLPALKIYRTFCIERWTNLQLRHTYTVSTILIQFFVPLVATSFLYIQISNVLKRRPIKKNERHNKNKTNKILIAIVLLFSICWLPWNLFALTLEFNFTVVSLRHLKLIDLLLKIFAMGSACINPFLYGWLNENFRKELNVMVKRQGRNRIRSNGQAYTHADPSRTEPMLDKVEKYATAIL